MFSEVPNNVIPCLDIEHHMLEDYSAIRAGLSMSLGCEKVVLKLCVE